MEYRLSYSTAPKRLCGKILTLLAINPCSFEVSLLMEIGRRNE